MKYRAEIDGLRALAVVPVIFFHAGFDLFSGGYVGVDVFFVISGYLITTILIDDIENKKFSIRNFYERRARRILPALFCVMLCCVPFAWAWMDADAYKDFSQSLVAVSIFSSNVLFWRESGYFDVAAEQKPLLHTWSLAVEEQYYVVFPIFLIVAWRFGRNRVFWTIVVLAAISFALSEWGQRANATANFYLAPTRAWELLAGSIVAFIIQKRGVAKNNALAWLGLVAIGFSIFVYDRSTPFPSVYTLLPVLGVVLLVLFANKETGAAKLLSTKLLVGIGLISYSAYLWHQPMFAFARIQSIDEPAVALMCSLSFLSIVFAWITWKYVEQPFRLRNKISKGKVIVFSVVAISLPMLLGIAGHVQNGFAVEREHGFVPSVKPMLNEDIVVLGDSHGQHLISGFRRNTSGNVRDLTSLGCIPFRNVDRYDFRFERGACASMMNAYLDKIREEDPKAIVVLASMGPVYLLGTPFKGKDKDRITGLGVELISDPGITDRRTVFEIGMRNTLAELASLENVRLVFAIDVPELGIDRGCQSTPKRLETPLFKLGDYVSVKPTDIESSCYVSRSEYDRRSSDYKTLVFNVVKDFPSVEVFDPTNAFCDDEKCKGFSNEYGYLYNDVDHLSDAGSLYFATKFAEFLSLKR